MINMLKKVKKICAFLFYRKLRIQKKVDFLIKLQKKNKLKILRYCIEERLQRRYNIIISDHAVIGSIKLPHPYNIGIGREVVIGENCTIYHDAMIGQLHNQFPKIGNNVIVYIGAVVTGGITVGDNAVIGANSVVSFNVPANAVVGGNPAKIIRYREEQDVFV